MRGKAEACALGAGAVGMGGCAQLHWSMAGLRSKSSARLRCALTLRTIAERPPESEAGVEGESLEPGALRSGAARFYITSYDVNPLRHLGMSRGTGGTHMERTL